MGQGVGSGVFKAQPATAPAEKDSFAESIGRLEEESLETHAAHDHAGSCEEIGRIPFRSSMPLTCARNLNCTLGYEQEALLKVPELLSVPNTPPKDERCRVLERDVETENGDGWRFRHEKGCGMLSSP